MGVVEWLEVTLRSYSSAHVLEYGRKRDTVNPHVYAPHHEIREQQGGAALGRAPAASAAYRSPQLRRPGQRLAHRA